MLKEDEFHCIAHNVKQHVHLCFQAVVPSCQLNWSGTAQEREQSRSLQKESHNVSLIKTLNPEQILMSSLCLQSINIQLFK